MASPFKDLQCRTDLGEGFKWELLAMFDKVLDLFGEAKGVCGHEERHLLSREPMGDGLLRGSPGSE